MLSFESDYILGAHEKVLDALLKTNNEVMSGYGNDIHTQNAKKLIKNACESQDSEVFFLTGGTQANAVVISTMLKNFEGVVSAKTGHIALHEVGAIEYTGHKVIELEGFVGKLQVQTLKNYLEGFYGDENNSMMVVPKMVYISHPTEYGTLYSKNELMELREICDKYSMKLFLDGARLGYGLMSKESDVSLPDIAKICDVFYIGGTKCAVSVGKFDGTEVSVLGREETRTLESPLETLGKLASYVDEWKEQYGVRYAGISCGGPLDSSTGVIISTPNLAKGWVQGIP